jgi:hypothetical protein
MTKDDVVEQAEPNFNLTCNRCQIFKGHFDSTLIYKNSIGFKTLRNFFLQYMFALYRDDTWGSVLAPGF